MLSKRRATTQWAPASKLNDQELGVNNFIFDRPASMDKVKKLCGFDNVES